MVCVCARVQCVCVCVWFCISMISTCLVLLGPLANISALRKIKWRAMKEKALSSFKSYVEDILLSYSLAGGEK